MNPPQDKKPFTQEQLVEFLTKECVAGRAIEITVHVVCGQNIQRFQHIFHKKASSSIISRDWKRMTRDVSIRLRELRNEDNSISTERVVPEGDEPGGDPEICSRPEVPQGDPEQEHVGETSDSGIRLEPVQPDSLGQHNPSGE